MRFFRPLLFVLLLGVLVPEVKAQDVLDVKRVLVLKGMKFARRHKINAIIVHSTFNDLGGDKFDIKLVMKQFAQYGVSANYVIARDGTIYCLVKEKNIAFHAGESKLPNGEKCLNSNSIGIELINSFDEKPTPQQIKWLTVLVRDIKRRYNVQYILRHSDIAPGRKTDPWNMDWEGFLKGL